MRTFAKHLSCIHVQLRKSYVYQIRAMSTFLHLGGVAEHGGLAQVIANLHHPYTRLLTRSLPILDPAIGWGENVVLPPEDVIRRAGRGG